MVVLCWLNSTRIIQRFLKILTAWTLYDREVNILLTTNRLLFINMNNNHFFNKLHLLVFFCMFAASTAMANGADDARDVIKTTAEGVIEHVKTNRASLEQDPSKLYTLVNERLVPIVDFQRVSRWILGKHWRKATDEQKLQFTNEFKKLLIKTYSTALLKISDEKLVYPTMKGDGSKGKVTVKSEVILPDGRHFAVNYRMHNKDSNSWKIYDISVDGVSLISTYRSSFKTEIRKVGIDGLIDNLVKKNDGFEI